MDNRDVTKKPRFSMEGDQTEIWPRAISVFKRLGFVKVHADEHAAVAKWKDACKTMRSNGKSGNPPFPSFDGQPLGFRVALELGLAEMERIPKEQIDTIIEEINR